MSEQEQLTKMFRQTLRAFWNLAMEGESICTHPLLEDWRVRMDEQFSITRHVRNAMNEKFGYGETAIVTEDEYKAWQGEAQS